MSAHDLIYLGNQMLLWFTAIIMFIVMMAILVVGFIVTVEVGIIAYKEVRKNVRTK